MFKRIAETLNADLNGVATIGDSLRDLQAGAAAAAVHCWCSPARARRRATRAACPSTLIFANLAAAVDHLLSRETKENERGPLHLFMATVIVWSALSAPLVMIAGRCSAASGPTVSAASGASARNGASSTCSASGRR